MYLFRNTSIKYLPNSKYSYADAVADPGFSVGGTPTSDMGTFWQKRENERIGSRWGGGAGGRRRRPLNPPMQM